MYSEKTYKNYIFWLKVRRIVTIIILSCLGAAIGILIGKILESTVQITSFNNAIIAVSSIIFFLLGVLFTIGTGKQVQDGYWRIAVLRKLTVIQKDLELNNELLKKGGLSSKDKNSLKDNIKEEEVTETEIANSLPYVLDETALVPKKKKTKKKGNKTIKKPEELK